MQLRRQQEAYSAHHRELARRSQLEDQLVAQGFDLRSVREALDQTNYDLVAATHRLTELQHARITVRAGLPIFQPSDLVLDAWDITTPQRMLYRTACSAGMIKNESSTDDVDDMDKLDCGVVIYNTPSGQPEDQMVGVRWCGELTKQKKKKKKKLRGRMAWWLMPAVSLPPFSLPTLSRLSTTRDKMWAKVCRRTLCRFLPVIMAMGKQPFW